MPSLSYGEWRSVRARALDEIAQGHAAVSGTRRGRRFNTQQFNRAYAVMLASQFQGFCRDLHSQCVDHLVRTIPSPLAVRPLVRDEFTRDRKLDRGNAQPSSLGADFRRLGIDLWNVMRAYEPETSTLMKLLDDLNLWRNAIAHQDFDQQKRKRPLNPFVHQRVEGSAPASPGVAQVLSSHGQRCDGLVLAQRPGR
jgi:hypothetical protein